MPATAAPEAHGLSSTALGRIGSWMGRYIDEGKLPGALTLVARHGEILFLECQGAMDLESGKAVTEDTIFRLYSMTKPVTSAAALMLHEEGRLLLDDPVERFIPDFAELRVHVAGEGPQPRSEPAERPVSIGHLLTHTSGLTYGSMDEGPVARLYRAERTDFDPGPGSLAGTIERLARLPLVCQPGTAWNYGVSTDVLGRVIEAISGEPLDLFFRRRILDPLAMDDTGFQLPPEKLPRFAALYRATGAGGLELAEAPATSPFADTVTLLSGGSGLVGTAGDYFRFAEMLRNRGGLGGIRLLKPETVELMTRNRLPGDLAAMGQPTFGETTFEGMGFGLGVAVLLDPARAGVPSAPGEYAWGGNASTAFWVDPREALTVIFLTQVTPSDSYPLRRELRKLVYGALMKRDASPENMLT